MDGVGFVLNLCPLSLYPPVRTTTADKDLHDPRAEQTTPETTTTRAMTTVDTTMMDTDTILITVTVILDMTSPTIKVSGLDSPVAVEKGLTP